MFNLNPKPMKRFVLFAVASLFFATSYSTTCVPSQAYPTKDEVKDIVKMDLNDHSYLILAKYSAIVVDVVDVFNKQIPENQQAEKVYPEIIVRTIASTSGGLPG